MRLCAPPCGMLLPCPPLDRVEWDLLPVGVLAVCEWVDALADKHTTCYTTTTGGFEFSVTGALVKRKDFLDTDVEAKVRFCLECVRVCVCACVRVCVCACVRVCIMCVRDVRTACLIYPP